MLLEIQWQIFHAYSRREHIMLNESCLYQINTLSRIFKVLAHEGKSTGKLATLPRHFILTLGRPVSALNAVCLAKQQIPNFDVFGLYLQKKQQKF